MFKKGGFPFATYPPPLPHSMLEYNRTVSRKSTLVLFNVVPKGGGGVAGKKAIRKHVSLPNTFDDDCELKL